MKYPKDFEKLIDCFKRLPGVGFKSAERMAHHVLNFKPEYLEEFSNSLLNVKNLRRCKTCNNLTDSRLCDICSDLDRNTDIICVVQDIKDLFAIERSNYFNGVFHVLDGVISPNKGILPENLNLDGLIARANEAKEIIIATNPNIDGETTALFIANLLKRDGLKITRLAYGLPMGGNLEYSDEVTILKSFENRRSF